MLVLTRFLINSQYFYWEFKIDKNKFYKDDAFAKLAKNELEKKFHTKVDLIPSNTKNTYLRILKKEQILI